MTVTVAVRYGNKNVDRVVNNTLLAMWELLLNTNVGSRVKTVDYKDKTFQVYGTFGGATLTMRGSNKESPDETVAGDWFTLTDGLQASIAKAAAAGDVILENPMWLSPIVASGDGTTSLNVAVSAVKRY